VTEPTFLTLADVLDIHLDQIEDHGGEPGIRDFGLLDSALAQPGMVAFGVRPHSDLFEMAAAYLFHIARNHPFLDGNKRTGLEAALVFLEINGRGVSSDPDELAELVEHVADGSAGKKAIADYFRGHSIDKG